MKNGIDLQEIRNFVDTLSDATKIYVGCDSERFRIDGVWHAKYIKVVVVHIDGNHGCRMYGETTVERDYDKKVARPAYRMMQEVYKVAELYLKLAPMFDDREIEIHLDINPNLLHGSSCVVDQAIGYIKGTCNVVPMVKPKAWAGSYCADRYESIMTLVNSKKRKAV